MWRNGEISTLPTLGGAHSSVSAVNERDQIVGQSSVSGSPISGDVHAVLWQEDGVVDLGVSPSAFRRQTVMRGVGQPTSTSTARSWGTCRTCGSEATTTTTTSSAFLWQGGKVTMVATGEQGSGLRLCDGGANAINDGGQIVGRCKGHAFVWQDGKMTDLGTLPGGESSGAVAINDEGQVVGTSAAEAGARHAVKWTLRRG